MEMPNFLKPKHFFNMNLALNHLHPPLHSTQTSAQTWQEITQWQTLPIFGLFFQDIEFFCYCGLVSESTD